MTTYQKFEDYIGALEMIGKATREEWETTIREDSERFDEPIESWEIEEIIDALEEEGYVETKWYAVQKSTEDAWDYGSHDYDETVEMLRKQGNGLIAVINEDTNYCEKEIWFEEVAEMKQITNKEVAQRLDNMDLNRKARMIIDGTPINNLEEIFGSCNTAEDVEELINEYFNEED